MIPIAINPVRRLRLRFFTGLRCVGDAAVGEVDAGVAKSNSAVGVVRAFGENAELSALLSVAAAKSNGLTAGFALAAGSTDEGPNGMDGATGIDGEAGGKSSGTHFAALPILGASGRTGTSANWSGTSSSTGNANTKRWAHFGHLAFLPRRLVSGSFNKDLQAGQGIEIAGMIK